jgi:hypothetical protein
VYQPTTQLAVVKDYIVRRLSQENQLIAEDQRCINNYREETEKMKKEFEELRSGYVSHTHTHTHTHNTRKMTTQPRL